MQTDGFDVHPIQGKAMARFYNSLSVIIPVFNECEGIAGVTTRIHTAMKTIPDISYEVIVVDDGSTDGTAEKIPLDGTIVIRHPKNYGYGRALLTGVDHARYPLIAIIDGDGTYDPQDIIRLFPLMKIYDMAIGSRQMKDQSRMVSLLRITLKAIIYFFSEHYSLDPNSGLRIFHKDLVVRGKSLFSQKFSFSTSLTFFSALQRQFIEYIPIEYHARSGFSKVRHVRDSIRTFILVMSMALVYQPVKCFGAILFITSALLATMVSFRKSLGRERLAICLVVLLNAGLVIPLAFLGFILSKIYTQNNNAG